LAAAKRSVIRLANLGEGSFEGKRGERGVRPRTPSAVKVKKAFMAGAGFNPAIYPHGSCTGSDHVQLLHLTVTYLTNSAK
jgi:hypothetical protein